MKILSIIRQHWRKFAVVILLILCLVLAKMTVKKSLIIGDPDNIIVISPEQSQDVIVIGDPETIKVKPKNKK